MGVKDMEGDNRHRRRMAKEAKKAGKKPSEIGATKGASQQRTKAARAMTHQEKFDLRREGKQDNPEMSTPVARPGSRDRETPDRERYPRR
jgi:hypothetical protein